MPKSRPQVGQRMMSLSGLSKEIDLSSADFPSTIQQFGHR
jgi:hypothetical protein